MADASENARVTSTSALAARLGLSRWTVSRVLNGHAGVKPATERRIRQAMKELDFAPNPFARGLRGGRTGVVGICFETYSTPVFSKKLIAMQSQLRDRGYRALVELIDGNAALERQVAQEFLAMKAEALVFVGGPFEENAAFVKEACEQGRAAVALVDPVTPADLPTARLDRAFAMRESLRAMLRAGRRRVALLGIHAGVLYGPERVRALRSAAKALGLRWGEDVVPVTRPQWDAMDYVSGRGLADALLEEAPGCDGLIAINDQVAIGAMGRLQERGYRVPEDYALVGFDNLDVSSHLHPRLASVDHRADVIAREMSNLIFRQIEGGANVPPNTVKVRPQFIVRQSLGPVSSPASGEE